MISKPLGTVAKIIAGQSPASSTYNSTGDGLPFFQGKADFQEMFPTVRMWCTSPKRKEAEPGDILISVRAPVGAVNICNQKSIIGRGLSALRPSSSLDGLFLYYFLKANENQIDALGTGSTFKAITQETLKKIEIPHPPLEDQKRIAHLLGKVEGLIARRKQHLQQLDDLLKIVFLEMFGDPVRNEKGWDTNQLANECLKITDGTHDTPERLTSGVPFITGKHVRPFSIDYDGCDYVSQEDHRVIYSRCDPKYGDLLYTNIGVNLGTAAMNVVDYEFSMKNVALLRPLNESLIPRFLEHYLNYDKIKNKIISDLSSGGAQKFLGLGQIKKIGIILPPLDLQNQFAVIVENVEGLKSRYQQSLIDLESLYGALSQKAFKGKLDLSRVLLPTQDVEESVIEHFETTQKSEIGRVPKRPSLSDLVALTSVEGRIALLDQLLPAWLDQLGGTPFSAQHFMEHVKQRASELIDAQDSEVKFIEHENVQFGLPEYDHLKTWVFETLEQGHLKQSYADAANRVRITVAKG